MVTAIAIRDGELVEVGFCCAPHAREECKADPMVVWWELIDARGNVIDSADKDIEENLLCSKRIRRERR